MRKQYLGLACVLLALCVCSACAGGGADSGEETAKAFVTSVYTTNQNNRYDSFASSMEDSSAGLDFSTETYYKDLAKMADPELIDQMAANRIPMKYDMLYEADPVTVDSVDLTWDKTAQRYAFTVSAHNEAGAVEFRGEIGCGEGGAVNYFWES